MAAVPEAEMVHNKIDVLMGLSDRRHVCLNVKY